MTINKFQGRTRDEAIARAKEELGANAVILNIKEIKPRGFLSVFSSSTYEVTAAVEVKEAYQAPPSAMETHAKLREGINLAADEEIAIPQPMRTLAREEITVERRTEIPAQTYKEEKAPAMNEMHVSMQMTQTEQNFKERLDNLSELLEQKLNVVSAPSIQENNSSDELGFEKVVYKTLLRNGVHEKYVNQILQEVERFIRPGNNVDLILPNIYQKLVLKFGQPKTIELSGKKPNVVFFIGPTGVGKTTTIAKIASKYKVEYNRKVAFITADTYRIAATEQLRVYANILDAPMAIVYSVEEINDAIEQYLDYDLIFVDTAGFSHKNEQQRNDMKLLLNGVKEEYRKEVYLVLSATTKYNDLMEIVDIYNEISKYKLIFTKLDETSSYGNLLNIKLYADADLSYATIGQNVPDDIEVFDTQKIVKELLRGR